MQKKQFSIRPAFLIAGLLVTLSVSLHAQQRSPAPGRAGGIELGRGMSLMTPDLMQIASQSDLFLRFAEKIGLTKDQKLKLEDIFFSVQQYKARGRADMRIAEAELERLLTSDRVDISSVRAKVKEIEAIQSDATIKQIEWALQAISTLTHDQHLQIMLLARENLQAEPNSE